MSICAAKSLSVNLNVYLCKIDTDILLYSYLCRHSWRFRYIDRKYTFNKQKQRHLASNICAVQDVKNAVQGGEHMQSKEVNTCSTSCSKCSTRWSK